MLTNEAKSKFGFCFHKNAHLFKFDVLVLAANVFGFYCNNFQKSVPLFAARKFDKQMQPLKMSYGPIRN